MLLIFDLDGTLCVSSDLDDECYAEACRRTLDLPSIDTDWAAYPDATDPVIGRTLIDRHLPDVQSDPTAGDRALRQLHDAFVHLIRERIGPQHSRQTPGAASLLQQLAQHSHAHAAVATGGWRESATLKLQHAGIQLPTDIPMRTSYDALRRVDIIRAAWNAVEARLGRTVPKHDVVYLGDGVWDLKATRQLDIGFLGVVVEHGKAQRLAEEGVPHRHMLERFPDADQLLDLARQVSPAAHTNTH